MRRPLIVLLALLALTLAACGGDDNPAIEDDPIDTAAPTDTAGTGETGEAAVVTLALAEMNGSGITGTATLTEVDGSTQVVVEMQGAGTGPQPIHIHPGTCANLDPAPQYPLTNVEDGRSETTVEASLASLQGGSFAINVHKSPEEAQIYVACGDIA